CRRSAAARRESNPRVPGDTSARARYDFLERPAPRHRMREPGAARLPTMCWCARYAKATAPCSISLQIGMQHREGLAVSGGVVDAIACIHATADQPEELPHPLFAPRVPDRPGDGEADWLGIVFAIENQR